MIIPALLAIPLLAGLISIVIPRNRLGWLEVTATVALIGELVAIVGIDARLLGHQTIAWLTVFSVDAWGALVLTLIGIVGSAATAYSIGYLRTEVRKEIIGFRRVRQYFVLLHLFLLAMFAAVLTSSPVVTWIAVEATTLSTAFLVSFYHKPTSMEAAWKYLVLNSVGLLLGFLGTLVLLSTVNQLGISSTQS